MVFNSNDNTIGFLLLKEEESTVNENKMNRKLMLKSTI